MSETSIGKKVLKNMLSGWVASIARVIMGIMMVPFLLKYLGKEGYGLIGLFMIIVSCVDVADLGLRKALGRELSEKNASKDKHGFEALSSTALALYISMALLMSITLWLLTPSLLGVFKVKGEYYSIAEWLLPAFGTCAILMAFIIPVFNAGVTSFMRYDIINTVSISVSIASNVCLFLIIPFFPGQTIVVWSLITILALVVNLVVIGRVYKKICYNGRISMSLVTPSLLKPIFKLGGSMYALQMTNTLSEKSNPLIISSFFGPAGVALYQTGSKVCQMLLTIVLTFTNQLYPLTTQCHVLNQGDKQKKILLIGSKYTMLLGILVSTGLFVFAESFCKLWLYEELGDDYIVVASIMQLLAIVDLTSYARGTQWPILLGMKKLKLMVWIQIPSAVVNILTSIYLVGYTDLGLAGAVYPTILLNLLRLPVLIYYVGKQVKITSGHYLKEAYLRPLICLLITFTGAKIWQLSIDCNTWLELVFAGVMTSIVWMGSLLFVGANQQERSQLIGYITKWASRSKV